MADHHDLLHALFQEIKCASPWSLRLLSAQAPYSRQPGTPRSSMCTDCTRLPVTEAEAAGFGRTTFREVDREKDGEAAEKKLRDVGAKLTECKRCGPDRRSTASEARRHFFFLGICSHSLASTVSDNLESDRLCSSWRLARAWGCLSSCESVASLCFRRIELHDAFSERESCTAT